MTAPSEPPTDRKPGCLAALAIGFVTVALANASWLVGRAGFDLSYEWGPLVFQVLLVAAPFGLLASMGVQGRWSWGAALAVTALFWGTYLVSGEIARRDHSGVNFGLILLMLVSPVLVAGAGLAAGKLAKEF